MLLRDLAQVDTCFDQTALLGITRSLVIYPIVHEVAYLFAHFSCGRLNFVKVDVAQVLYYRGHIVLALSECAYIGMDAAAHLFRLLHGAVELGKFLFENAHLALGCLQLALKCIEGILCVSA